MFHLFILNETYTNNFYYMFLNIISVLSILCGISVIVSKNPVVSVLFLIGLFFSVASYLMMLGLSFIGLSYLLVYVGAVSILFLFILMLINVRVSELVTDNNNSFILAILIGIFIIIPINSKGREFETVISNIVDTNINDITNSKEHLSSGFLAETGIINDLIQSFNKIYDNINQIFFVTSKIWDGALGETSHITTIGSTLYTSYPIWLILTSIILLLAMVGAIVITIKQ